MYQYPKNFLSIKQLVHKLESAGMAIPSQDDAENALTTIGYYRLKGYCFHLFDHVANQYVPGTSLADILKLYRFDTELSHLLFCYISHIEVALRGRLVDAFQNRQDALVLNDPSVFNDKSKYWKNQSTIAAEIARSNDVFIKHNFNNHDGGIPLWAAVEIMSFGTLSKTIKNLKTGTDSAFSVLVQSYRIKGASGRYIVPSKDMFTSWIQAVSILRNICAHNGRIYNRTISTRPQLPITDLRQPQPRYNGLYEIMLSMKYLRPTDSSWTDFISTFKVLLSKYSDVLDINRLNFPQDWEAHFQI